VRKVVIVNDRLAYIGDVVAADYRDRSPDAARAAMEQFAEKYRAGGWAVVDTRALVPAA
jgi:hypothetical protein